jgi:uncharacterized membrane protein
MKITTQTDIIGDLQALSPKREAEILQMWKLILKSATIAWVSWPEAPALANALHVFTLALLASFPLLERPTIQKRHIAAVESIDSLISVRSIGFTQYHSKT